MQIFIQLFLKYRHAAAILPGNPLLFNQDLITPILTLSLEYLHVWKFSWLVASSIRGIWRLNRLVWNYYILEFILWYSSDCECVYLGSATRRSSCIVWLMAKHTDANCEGKDSGTRESVLYKVGLSRADEGRRLPVILVVVGRTRKARRIRRRPN